MMYRFIEWVGRWSMLDIFVIAILVALVNFGNLASIEANLGAAAFASVVVLTMLAAVTFDPGLSGTTPIWTTRMSDLPSPKKHKTLELVGDLLPLVAWLSGPGWLARLRPGRGVDPGALREQRWHPGEDRGAVQGHRGRQGRRAGCQRRYQGRGGHHRNGQGGAPVPEQGYPLLAGQAAGFPGWRHRPGNPGIWRLHRGRSGEGREGRTQLHRAEAAAPFRQAARPAPDPQGRSPGLPGAGQPGVLPADPGRPGEELPVGR